MQFNQVTVSGNLVGDPESAVTKTGTDVCKFRIANNQGSNERRHTNFLDVSIFGKAGTAAAKVLQKGDEVRVSGSLKIEEYESRDGTPRKSVAIEGNTVQYVKCKAWESSGDNTSEAPRVPTQNKEEVPF